MECGLHDRHLMWMSYIIVLVMVWSLEAIFCVISKNQTILLLAIILVFVHCNGNQDIDCSG